MKKVFLFLSLLLSLGLLSGCSSNDEITDVSKEKAPNENNSNENGGDLLEVWELRTIDRSWGMITTFSPNEVTCYIYANGIIEVINETDNNLSPFVNSGSYPFKAYTKDGSKNYVSINGIEFEKEIDKDETLHLYYNSIESYWADGEKYDFVIIK